MHFKIGLHELFELYCESARNCFGLYKLELTINRQQYIIHFPPILFFFPIITKGILEEKKEKGYIGGSNLFRWKSLKNIVQCILSLLE